MPIWEVHYLVMYMFLRLVTKKQLFLVGFQSCFPKERNLYRQSTNQLKKTANSKATGGNQAKIDAILDKISKSGYDTLTKEEKEFLFKQSN